MFVHWWESCSGQLCLHGSGTSRASPQTVTPTSGFNLIPQFSPFLFRLEQAALASLCVLGVPVKHQTLAQCPGGVFSSSYQLLSDHKTRPRQSSPQKALLSSKWADSNLSWVFFFHSFFSIRGSMVGRFYSRDSPADWYLIELGKKALRPKIFKQTAHGDLIFLVDCPRHTRGTGLNYKLSSRDG